MTCPPFARWLVRLRPHLAAAETNELYQFFHERRERLRREQPLVWLKRLAMRRMLIALALVIICAWGFNGEGFREFLPLIALYVCAVLALSAMPGHGTIAKGELPWAACRTCAALRSERRLLEEVGPVLDGYELAEATNLEFQELWFLKLLAISRIVYRIICKLRR